MDKKTKVRKLTESALLIAIATVLSVLKIAELPYGGSITIASMLPIIIISYRYGIRWGLICGLAYAALQQLFGLNMLSYATSWQAMVAIILLDYIVAFTVTGLGGIFKKLVPQPVAFVLGSLLVGFIRFICHVISGATVWAGLSIPTEEAFVYSIGYNATYMLPEVLILMIVGFYLASMLDFGGETLRPYNRSTESKSMFAKLPIQKWIGGIIIAGALIFDTVMIFSKLQNPQTGDFDITGLSAVQWTWIAIISLCAAIAGLVLYFLSERNDLD
ncbi:MAG: energy-coupled thiamine transporter ThiT [Lachnospiraceae bacterium]|nr:energy-coupled thiamine transporter ThiT [Lachnospiraceae bacterium]